MIRVYKSARRLEVEKDGQRLFSCPVQLGAEPAGPKLREGDGRTPEGEYRVCTVNRQSRFTLSLGISYPGRKDALRARREGRISLLCCLRLLLADALRLRPAWNTPLGGFIMIHGPSPEGKTGDWTQGCIALASRDILALAALVKKGEKVQILP